MGIQERRERERDRTRAKIMNAARDLFAREGYEAVSMRRIADVVEYSPTAIYVHFKDKEALFAELVRDDFDKLADVFRDLARVQDPVERIRGTGQNYIRFALEYPNHYRLMFMTGHRKPAGELPAHRGDPDRDAYAFLRATADEAIKQGRFRPEFNDADLAAQTLWATVHGVASLQIVKGADPWIDWSPLEKRACAAIDSILRGMLAGPGGLKPVPKRRKVRVR